MITTARTIGRAILNRLLPGEPTYRVYFDSKGNVSALSPSRALSTAELASLKAAWESTIAASIRNPNSIISRALRDAAIGNNRRRA